MLIHPKVKQNELYLEKMSVAFTSLLLSLKNVVVSFCSPSAAHSSNKSDVSVYSKCALTQLEARVSLSSDWSFNRKRLQLFT